MSGTEAAELLRREATRFEMNHRSCTNGRRNGFSTTARAEDRERHISNARPRIAAPSRFFARNVTHQSRKLAALRFRAGFLRNLPANRRAKKQTLSGG